MRRRSAVSSVLATCALVSASPVGAQVPPAPAPGPAPAATPYVFGGVPAPFGTFPFLAVLLRAVPGGFAVYCGGTLVRPDLVLTAAHCVVGQAPPDLVVIGQASAAPTPDALGDSRVVAEVVVDPSYAVASNSHDLALLRLSEPATRRPAHRVRPATGSLAAVGAVGVGMGFGSTVADDEQFVAPIELQQTPLTVQPDSACADAYGAAAYLSDRMLCAGALGSGVCRGDSGGPLAVAGPTRWWAVAGVVSFGAVDCDDAPAAFTDLSEAGNDAWLTSVVGERAALWSVERIAGSDRFATATAISQSAFPGGAATAFVVTGDAFPDALAVGPVAAMAGAPVVLVQRNSVPAVTRTELERLDPDRIVVVGGTGAVGEGTVAALATIAPVERVGGDAGDRVGTAVAVATDWAPGASTVYVANGFAFPDALAGGVAAARDGAPLLLVEQNALPAATAAYLQGARPTRIVVLGGTTAVDDSVVAALAGVSGATVERIAGTNRYGTAAAVAARSFPTGSPLPVALVATGENYPDALSATPAAFLAGAPVLLTPPGFAAAEVFTDLYRSRVASVRVLGAAGAVADAAVAELTAG